MRILWLGNPPFAPSGYGEQAGLFLPRFKQLGHDVAVVCNYGLQGAKLTLGGIEHYPGGDGAWGNLALPAAVEHYEPDLVINLQDAWTQNPNAWGENMPPVGMWTPVDHYPIPPKVLATLTHDLVRPVAMSRFGHRLMLQAGLEEAVYVPHGVDTALFQPAEPGRRDLIRDKMGIPRTAFLVGMVAANKSNPEVDRKSFSKSFQAFARFARRHPDAHMYVHSQANPPGHDGINLDVLAGVVGTPAGRLKFSPDHAWHIGMPRELVATLYQAFDVLLNPSMGEGFGVPIIEAQASGVPVITSNHTAMPELTHAGWLVEGDPWWDALQTAFFFDPFVSSIESALEEAYRSRDDTELRDAAVRFAAAYDADTVTDKYWKPALETLTRPVSAAQPPAGGFNRAERRRAEKAARKATQKGVTV